MIGATLTPLERQQVREKAVMLNDRTLEKLAIFLKEKRGPEAERFALSILEERKIARRAAATPLHVTGQPRTQTKTGRHRPASEIAAPAPFERVRPWLLPVVVVGGAGTLTGLVVIPALVAIGTAVAAAVAAVVPYLLTAVAVIVSGVAAVSLFSRGSGEKKTGYSESGPRIVNIHVNQGDQVTINQK